MPIIFLAFSDLNWHLEDTGISAFWLHCIKETKLGSSNQEVFPSAGKNTRVVSVPCLCMEVRPYRYFQWYGYFWGPYLSFVTADEFSVSVTKIIQGLVSNEPTAYLSIFNLFKVNELWPYYQKHVILNSANLSSLTLQIFDAFVRILLIVNLSLNQTLLTFLWDKPGWLNWFCQFLCERLSSFNPKGF